MSKILIGLTTLLLAGCTAIPNSCTNCGTGTVQAQAIHVEKAEVFVQSLSKGDGTDIRKVKVGDRVTLGEWTLTGTMPVSAVLLEPWYDKDLFADFSLSVNGKKKDTGSLQWHFVDGRPTVNSSGAFFAASPEKPAHIKVEAVAKKSGMTAYQLSTNLCVPACSQIIAFKGPLVGPLIEVK